MIYEVEGCFKIYEEYHYASAPVVAGATRAHRRAGSKPLDEAGDIGQFTERDFCQTEAASDVISSKGERGD